MTQSDLMNVADQYLKSNPSGPIFVVTTDKKGRMDFISNFIDPDQLSAFLTGLSIMVSEQQFQHNG